MKGLLAIIGTLVAFACITWLKDWWCERKEKKERELRKRASRQSQPGYGANAEGVTLALMRDALLQLGCQPTENEDGTLSVQYQGENFHMDFGGRYTRVWDPTWAGAQANDPDLPKLREAVNAANFHFGPTIVMSAPDNDGVINLHSRRDIMLHPACPDNVPFVKAVLDSFFQAKENVRNNLHQIKTQQTELQQSRRPVGFYTNYDNDNNNNNTNNTNKPS